MILFEGQLGGGTVAGTVEDRNGGLGAVSAGWTIKNLAKDLNGLGSEIVELVGDGGLAPMKEGLDAQGLDLGKEERRRQDTLKRGRGNAGVDSDLGRGVALGVEAGSASKRGGKGRHREDSFVNEVSFSP